MCVCRWKCYGDKDRTWWCYWVSFCTSWNISWTATCCTSSQLVTNLHLQKTQVVPLLISVSVYHTVWVKKIPPLVSIFPKRLGIFQPNFARLSTLDYEFLFNYLQPWRNYAILSVITQFKSCVQNVHHQPKCMLAFSDIFPKQLGIFSPNFTHLLNVHMYARVQISIQLSPTVTKLCHIKCDHPVCISTDGGRFEHIMVVALNMA